MPERGKNDSSGPAQDGDFASDTEHGYLEGYQGREFEGGPERPADFADAGDWGRQGEWGTFSNRPAWRRDQSWPETLASELATREK